MRQDLFDVIPFLIEQVSKKSRKYSQREFDDKELGITVDQWVLLKIVEQNNGISQRELADLSMRDAASITRSLDLLEKMTLISRNPIDGNRRQYSIRIEKKGEQFIKNNMEMVGRHRAQLVDGLSEGEINQIKRLLSQMIKNMD